MRKLPEYYFIVFVILCGYSPPFSINPISIVLVGILILQIVSKNTVSGLMIGALFMLINLYMLLALISEFSEFKTFESAARQLLFVGLSLFAINTTASFLMILKYARPTNALPNSTATTTQEI